MNMKRLLAALMFALFCSGVLTWQIGKHLPRGSNTDHAVPMRPVVVAAKDVRPGDILSGSSVTVIAWPMSRPLPGSFENGMQLNGQVSQVAIRPGEPIFQHDLAPVALGTGLALAIPGGMRAVTIRAADQSAQDAGFIVPGSFVDVLVTYRSGPEGGFVSSLVLQDTRVLAVGQNADVGTEVRSHPDDGITLLVSPEDAERLTSAGSQGKITVVLRNNSDRVLRTEQAALRRTDAGRASKHQVANVNEAVKKRPQLSSFTVETLAGGKAITQTFQGEQQ